MKLMTKALLKQLPPLYSTENVPMQEKIAVVKFFFPSGRATWYCVEYDPKERIFFGFVISPLGSTCDELGYFNLQELEGLKLGGLRIERDKFFKPTKLGELLKK